MKRIRSRAWRRAERARVIAARQRQARDLMPGRADYLHGGRLAREQAYLGCPDGRACPFCSRPYERAGIDREAAREALDALQLREDWLGDDGEDW